MAATIIFAFLAYLGACLAACVLAGITSYPFLKPGDFPVQLQMILFSVVSGFYILVFVPFVITAEIMLRKARSHRALPLWALPVFGACFPPLGFSMFPGKWWPAEPFDMDSRHVIVFLLLTALALGMGILAIFVKYKRGVTKTPMTSQT